MVGGPPLVSNEVVQDLKQNIYKLEEEVSQLLQLKIIRFVAIILLVVVRVCLQQLQWATKVLRHCKTLFSNVLEIFPLPPETMLAAQTTAPAPYLIGGGGVGVTGLSVNYL